MGYKLFELELSEPLVPIQLEPGQHGCGIVARWHGRPVGFHMEELGPGATLAERHLRAISDKAFAANLLAVRVEDALPSPKLTTAAPSLSVAVCTRNRAARLARLLSSPEPAAPPPALPAAAGPGA